MRYRMRTYTQEIFIECLGNILFFKYKTKTHRISRKLMDLKKKKIFYKLFGAMKVIKT